MNKEQQEQHFDNIVEKMKGILISKGNDYASEDRLSNFKSSAQICKSTPEAICLGQIAIKVSRLGILLKSQKPNNESIQDSILDLANYTILLDMIVSESQLVSKTYLTPTK